MFCLEADDLTMCGTPAVWRRALWMCGSRVEALPSFRGAGAVGDFAYLLNFLSTVGGSWIFFSSPGQT
jgi:hypothetical protein